MYLNHTQLKASSAIVSTDDDDGGIALESSRQVQLVGYGDVWERRLRRWMTNDSD